MRKFINIIILILIILTPSSFVHADSDYLADLSILVYIHEDGSATIAERRRANITEGTENYDVIENLGKSTITDFFVQENDFRYEFVDPWDSDASREDKTFKNGIIKTEDGYELVWGIGEYGKHEYIIVYTVTDFIKQLEDKQILFWRFVNDDMNIPPQQVSIEIETTRPITSDTEKIWAFGFNGDIHFDDGKVVAKSEQPFDEDNYATVLIQFPQDTFQTNDKLDKTFAEVQEEAFEGSDYGKRSDLQFTTDILPYLAIGFILFVPTLIAYFVRFRKLFKQNKKLKNTYKKYEGQYYRDIPYEGHFIDLFYFLQQERFANYHNLILALFLKWLDEDRISLHTEITTKRFKKNKKYIRFHPTNDIDNEYERRLFNLFIQLKGPNESISLDDTSLWAKELQEDFAEWLDDVTENTRDQLVEDNYLQKEVVEKLSGPVDVYNLTETGTNLQKKSYGFINYMVDFSLVHEHDAKNVKIWNQFMVWAAVFGLTDVVRKQFETIYPDSTLVTLYDKDTIASLHRFTTHVFRSNYTSIGAASGAGGSASIGGGGGSFGGGSGGGTR